METIKSGEEPTEECRTLRGTWLWFTLNVLLFPGPAYFTLLRVREFSLARSSIHVSITLFLLLLIAAAAALQVIVPSYGKLWTLLPLLSGPLVLFMNRSIRGTFQPFAFKTVGKKYYVTLFLLLLIILANGILPELDLIAINEARDNIAKTSFQDLPLWQDTIILLAGILVLFGGYINNTKSGANGTGKDAQTVSPFSINRAIILYSIFLLLSVQLFIVLEIVFTFLKLTGGFGSQLGGVLLASVLAVDYHDAATFGQYTRRYFLLTCTKGISFMLLWFCFLGLPEKTASMYADRAYNKLKPIPTQISSRHFVLPYQDRFTSAHTAHRKLRILYSRALQSGNQEQLHELADIIDQQQITFPFQDTDIGYLQRSLTKIKGTIEPLDLTDLPFFRPVKVDWDVMLTAIVLQNDHATSELDQSIAGFKASLPKNSQGQLPDLDAPLHCSYVAYATQMQLDFVPPDFELLETLLANKLIPVLSLRLAGKNYWAALVHLDHASNLGWLRIENTRKMEEAIKLQFDASEAVAHKQEILTSQYLPVSLDYLTRQVSNMAVPVIVYSKEGLQTILPDRFTAKTLAATYRQVVGKSTQLQQQNSSSTTNVQESKEAEYTKYLGDIAEVKALLAPIQPEAGSFLTDSEQTTPVLQGRDRLRRVATILSRQKNLRDTDRMDIAYELISNNHIAENPELFIQLTAELPFSADMVDCKDAFKIGRTLYLLGQHQKGLDYLTIAIQRHPYFAEYEMWYRIALLKLGKGVPTPYTSPNRYPDLQLYFKTLYDVQNNNGAAARKRLAEALEDDSHNILANQLMYKYFNQPLDENFFFQASEGL